MEGEYDSSLIGPARADLFRTADEIKHDVEQLIAENELLFGSDIDVSVESGVVTLRGRVRDQAACDEAVNAAREVLGVVDVRNELEIG